MEIYLSDEEKNQLAEENIKLVYYLINELRKSFFLINKDESEVEGLAMLGYAKAIQSYNPSKKIQFSTYAMKCMQNEIFAFYNKEKKKVKTTSLNVLLNRDKNGNELTLDDIVSSDENNLSAELKGGEAILIEKETERKIEAMIETLSEIEKEVFVLKIGLFDGNKHTMKQISEILKLDKKEVNSIYNSALRKLRKTYVQHITKEQ